MGQYLMGIDNGLTLSKVALFDLAGREDPGRQPQDRGPVSQARLHRAGHGRRLAEDGRGDPGGDRGVGHQPSEILAIGNSGHGNGLYMLDRDGKAFRPSIASMDGRAGRSRGRVDPAGRRPRPGVSLHPASVLGRAADRPAGLAEAPRAGDLPQDRQGHAVHGLHQVLPDRRAHHRLLDHQRQQPARIAEVGAIPGSCWRSTASPRCSRRCRGRSGGTRSRAA